MVDSRIVDYLIAYKVYKVLRAASHIYFHQKITTLAYVLGHSYALSMCRNTNSSGKPSASLQPVDRRALK